MSHILSNSDLLSTFRIRAMQTEVFWGRKDVSLFFLELLMELALRETKFKFKLLISLTSFCVR